MEEEAVIGMISEAIMMRSSSQLEKSADEMSNLVTDQVAFPEKSFVFVLDLMQKEEFLTLDGSHHILMLFNFYWVWLDDTQKQMLLPILETSYDNFTDWMSWFVISELLGEYYNDERAFATLQRLKETPAEGPRSFVPHGFEHLATSMDDSLATKARNQLLSMANDPSEQVRNEVSISLHRLSTERYR